MSTLWINSSMNIFPSSAFCKVFILFSFSCIALSSLWDMRGNNAGGEVVEQWEDYGVDVSFPIHHRLNPNTYWGKQYAKHMQGCYDAYDRRSCDATEQARLEMSLRQPATQHNYTDIGFKKIRAPKELWDPLIAFYTKYKDQLTLEHWPPGNTYVNNWIAPSYMISFENKNLRGGIDTKKVLWDAAKPVIEEWTGKKLVETSLYGIRVYSNHSILATHVDRLPLVSSCIINVDQDLEEPWPIEVYARDGKAYNVTMVPGDMVLYESHSTLHGRPFPMKGKHYANVFIHFSPIDHDEMNEKDEKLRKPEVLSMFQSNVVKEGNKKLKDTLLDVRKRIGGHEQSNHDDETLKRHASTPKGQTDLHVAAAAGNLASVVQLLSREGSSDLLRARDENGWQAIHEAARSGHLDIVKYFVEKGADVSAETTNGETVMWWARRYLPSDHEMIAYLTSMNAAEGIQEAE